MYSSSAMLNYSKVVGKVFFRRTCVFMSCPSLLAKVLQSAPLQKMSVQEQNINPGLAKIYVSFHVFKDTKPFAIIFKKRMISDSPPKDRQRLCHTPGLLALNL